VVVPVVGSHRGVAVGLALSALLGGVGTAAADEAPCALVVDDLARVRPTDRLDCPLDAEAPYELGALLDEVVAFQVLVESGPAPLEGVTVDLVFPDAPGLRIERFVEHTVKVDQRSRGGKDAHESLGWTPAARPADTDVLGEIPDALVPVESAPAWRPYPLRLTPRTMAAIWIDVGVPVEVAPGRHTGELIVQLGEGGRTVRKPVSLTVIGARLPYRAVSVLAGYDGGLLAERLDWPADSDGSLARRSIWQVLHAHGVDALAGIDRVEDAAFVAGALDGSWFTRDAGYRGPGEGVAPAVVTLGAYGKLGAPEAQKRGLVEALAAAIPARVQDVFLYAVDEDCRSDRGPGWRRILAGAKLARSVLVGHSCSEDPTRQDVDLVLMVADAWNERDATLARQAGKRVWVYNGRLPHAATMLLDAPASAPAALGWIAATHAVDRWFLWAANFWNDDNQGGKGPIDPFASAASFHNQHGDVALFDGLLVYPGTQKAPFAAHSVGVPGVLPSMRLKRLRRGIQDAGYLALVGARNPEAALAIAAKALPRALDELDGKVARGWRDDGADFAQARAELRALVPEGAALTETQAREALGTLAERRARTLPHVAPVYATAQGSLGVALGAMAALWVFGMGAAFALAAWTNRRRTRGSGSRVTEAGSG
jgi:hypothetical protein